MRSTTKRADPLKKLLEKHQDERRHLHQWYKAQNRITIAERRTAYKKLKTQPERATLLAASSQNLNQLKQTHALNYEHLLAQQAQERANLWTNLTGPDELDRRKRVKLARLVIETAVRSGTLGLIRAIPVANEPFRLSIENRKGHLVGTTHQISKKTA